MEKLTDEQIKSFKEKLLSDKEELEEKLKTVGRINPTNPEDWEPTPEKIDVMRADKNEAADAIEEFEENTAILRELEIRLVNIKKALGKVEDNSYGVCEISGNPIELKRLEANPAARTCVKHAGEIEGD